MDAAKKLWRSIYAKVENVDPGLLATVESGTPYAFGLAQALEGPSRHAKGSPERLRTDTASEDNAD